MQQTRYDRLFGSPVLVGHVRLKIGFPCVSNGRRAYSGAVITIRYNRNDNCPLEAWDNFPREHSS